MRALLFAAGRGERMRPLSDRTPKVLLRAGGKCLIEWQIGSLVRGGARELVINTAHLAAQVEAALGDGSRYGARIVYSHEGDTAGQALETLGGIIRALPLLGPDPFIVASGDIVTDFDYGRLAARAEEVARGEIDAHLVLVDNPPFHPQGDMGLARGRATRDAPLLNYGNIGVFAPRLFAAEPLRRQRLFPWMYAFVERGRVGAEHWRGRWFNVGTPEELAQLDAELGATGGAVVQ